MSGSPEPLQAWLGLLWLTVDPWKVLDQGFFSLKPPRIMEMEFQGLNLEPLHEKHMLHH